MRVMKSKIEGRNTYLRHNEKQINKDGQVKSQPGRQIDNEKISHSPAWAKANRMRAESGSHIVRSRTVTTR